MESKRSGIKLLFAMISLLGAGVALSSCGKQPAEEKNPTSEVVEIEPTPSGEVTPGTSTEPTETEPGEQGKTEGETEGKEEQVVDDTADRVNFEIKIEGELKDKINDRLEEEAVKNVDAKYFTLNDSQSYGKTLETTGFVTLANDEIKPVTLGLPLTDAQYQSFTEVGITAGNESAELYQNYSKEQLSEVCSVVEDKNVTYSYAVLDGAVWDLDQLTAAKLENMLEQKYTQEIYNYFADKYNDPSLDRVDLKYAVTSHTSQDGNMLKYYGNTISKKGTVLPLIITLKIDESNYQNLSEVLVGTYDKTKEMAENHSKEELFSVYQVSIAESTQTKYYTVNGGTFVVNYENNNDMNL